MILSLRCSVFIGCTFAFGCDSALEGVRHPILDDYDGSFVSAKPDSVEGLEDLQARLSRLTRLVEFGSLDGAPETVFGRPSDLAVTSKGDLFILDAATSEVRAFTSTGRFVASLVTQGQGPSEMLNPLSIDIVLDRPDNRSSREQLVLGTRTHVKIFGVDGDTVNLAETIGPPTIPLPADVCATGKRIFVRASNANGTNIVTSYDRSTDRSFGFGDGYQHGSSLPRSELSRGPIACLPNGDVVVGHTYLPRLTAYDSVGTIRWSVDLPDFNALTFTEIQRSGRPAFVSSYEHAGDMVQVIQPFPPNGVLVQTLRLKASTKERPRVQMIERRSTYLLSAHTGRGALVGTTLPILLAATDSILWAVDEASAGHLVIVGFKY